MSFSQYHCILIELNFSFLFYQNKLMNYLKYNKFNKKMYGLIFKGIIAVKCIFSYKYFRTFFYGS